MVCPKMSIVGKATSIRGSQEEFPIGGTPRSGMEKGGEGAEFDHQEGAAEQLEVGMCSRQSKGFQGSLSQVTGEEPSQVSIRWSGTERQLVRVDSGVKGYLQDALSGEPWGTGATLLEVRVSVLEGLGIRLPIGGSSQNEERDTL